MNAAMRDVTGVAPPEGRDEGPVPVTAVYRAPTPPPPPGVAPASIGLPSASHFTVLPVTMAPPTVATSLVSA